MLDPNDRSNADPDPWNLYNFPWIRIRINNWLDLDPDPYQSSSWFRIRNKCFHILDPDPYQNDTDLRHCLNLSALSFMPDPNPSSQCCGSVYLDPGGLRFCGSETLIIFAVSFKILLVPM